MCMRCVCVWWDVLGCMVVRQVVYNVVPCDVVMIGRGV